MRRWRTRVGTAVARWVLDQTFGELNGEQHRWLPLRGVFPVDPDLMMRDRDWVAICLPPSDPQVAVVGTSAVHAWNGVGNGLAAVSVAALDELRRVHRELQEKHQCTLEFPRLLEVIAPVQE